MATDSSSDEMCRALVNALPAAALLVMSRERTVVSRVAVLSGTGRFAAFCKSKLKWNVVSNSRQCELLDVAVARDAEIRQQAHGTADALFCESRKWRRDRKDGWVQLKKKNEISKNSAALQNCGPASQKFHFKVIKLSWKVKETRLCVVLTMI